MNWNTIIKFYIDFWVITIPISLGIAAFIITEFLDLLLNTGNINRALKHSDSLNLNSLEKKYEDVKERQSKLTKSNLIELERQISHQRMIEEILNGNRNKKITKELEEKITAAKKVSDIFKIK